ncbi:hypothetical protein GLOIN_2v1880889 [Rhizophagus irregularis DAOM 181602=DAOM 197198]|nr:hypothetical protein GLOIN_2v1880889 [Rhizophagus irregularis DAOM 181602=DAOM 197198]
MESGNKLRESSRKKIEELLIEGNHKRSDRSQSRSRNNNSKTNINTSETINDEVNVLQTKRWLSVNSKIEEYTLTINKTSTVLAKWERKPKVKDCFEGLFKKMNPKDKNSSIVLASVIDRALQNDHSNAELAYVLAICSTILNLNHDEIRCKKNIMKQKVKKFLKKINSQTGIRYSDFEDNSYEEEESGNETEDDDDDV